MNHKAGQRRGLGRGLGSLIPTAPRGDSDTLQDDRAPLLSADEVPQKDEQGHHPLPPPHTPVDSNGAGDQADYPGSSRPDAAAESAPGLHLDAESARSDPPAGHGAYFAELRLDSISPNPRQPRQVFEEEAMAELVYSIREVGLLQPVVVRPLDEGRFELVMGERRWRAGQQAGLATLPAIVRETGDDALLRDALLENLHRAELNPLEEAAAYEQLLEDFGCTHEELATRLGRSRPQVSNTLRLLRLSAPVQRRVAAGVLSAGHARALLAVEDPDTQDRLAARVVAEGISVRSLEELVAVGDTGSRRRPSGHGPKPTAPGLEELASRLSDRLDTRVKVALGRSKGRITVEFASIPDLERIVDLLDPHRHAGRQLST